MEDRRILTPGNGVFLKRFGSNREFSFDIRPWCALRLRIMKALSCLRPPQMRFLALLGLFVAGVGDAQTWVQRLDAPITWWYSVACSADASNAVAAGNNLLYFSTNSGLTWTSAEAPGGGCQHLASSADGNRLFAIGNSTIWTWTRQAGAWTQTGAVVTNWQGIACSADGQKLVAANGTGWAAPPGNVYISTDAGATWSPTTAPAASWTCVASSAAATCLVAASASGPIYVSTNSGASWALTDTPSRLWASLACSASGATMCGVGFYDLTICTSTNFGRDWLQFSDSTVDGPFAGVASSADGTKLVVISASGHRGTPATAYFSTDSGATWASSFCAGATNYLAVASSADGCRAYAAITYGGILTIERPLAPDLNLIRSDADLQLSWTIPSATFSLQDCPDLSLGQWMDLNTPPTPNYTNLENQVNVSVQPAARFFRLVSH
jgi:hypothetical protein